MKRPLSVLCDGRLHCGTCRTDRAFREAVSATHDVPSVDFACPHGVPWSGQLGFGDRLASIIDRILRAMRMPKPTRCGCQARIDFLNRWWSARASEFREACRAVNLHK